ncbi:exodeoxyribonuclease I [Massilia sp. W12]|uniref:exodeoxyribonuclease I n=1 Tax=Massilia sp. W12 TaxID=3126507 RepID=UPI0030D27189
MSIQHSFLWHDYETFGANPRADRPAQFAAIRTNADLEEVGKPIMLYCQPGLDYLPDAQSCLITGITPQQCLERGVPEYQFAQTIEAAFAQPGTVGCGYNTLRFDDEVTRFLLWRNLLDPYAREWQNGCGRWDILDMARTTWALRPEGLQWPRNEEGKISFRLEHLSAANGIVHEQAHDALSDVRATIAMARLIRQAQPRLYDFCFALHKKERVKQELGLHLPLEQRRPVLHVSGMFGVERGCLALVFPLAEHPHNKNEVIVWDCAFDPDELFSLDAEQARLRMFSKTEDLPPGVARLPIKTIHLNRSPVVISALKTLSAARAEEFGMNLAQAQQHAEQLRAALQSADLSALWRDLYAREDWQSQDVDLDLYGGFVGPDDRRQLNSLRALDGDALAAKRLHFQDPRLEELLFRYRARNFPDSLNEAEQMRWMELCSARLLEGAGGARDLDSLLAQLDQLQEGADERTMEILEQVHAWAEQIAPM